MLDHLLFTEEEILERVDEYTLYCSYLGYEPLIGAKYESPLRLPLGLDPDGSPSFGVFERKKGYGVHEFMWKDLAANIHGNIFDLVKILLRYETKQQARQQVLIDAGIVPGERSMQLVDFSKPVFQSCAKITIASRKFTNSELMYWDRINVGKALLDEYFTTAVKMFWLFEDQVAPRFPRTTCYAYRMWDKYQLYFPYEPKKQKFRHDLTEACVPGFLQLRLNTDTLIITKSFKDVIALRSFGFEAVAPRGESVPIPPEFLVWAKTRYRRILILFDNDGKHKGDEYEFPKVFVPKLLPGDKDPTDFCVNHGIRETHEMLLSITNI